MILDLTNFKYIDLKLRLTNINFNQIDKLINLANQFTNDVMASAEAAIESSNAEKYDFTPALHEIQEAPKTVFSLYGLAIIHCYSNLEKNRNEILGEKFHKIEKITKHLKNSTIKHEDIINFNTMEEFREVNNGIKHNSTYGKLQVTTKSGKKYNLQELKALYAAREKLNNYLADLYDKYPQKNGKPST